MNAIPARISRPLLLVVSAPSGAGKTTLCDRLLTECPGMVYSISCTTRAPRGSEVDGQDYHFLSETEFGRRVAAGDFLEHAAVHGHRYGTLRQAVLDALAAGRDVLMDIDVQGAAQIRRAALAGDGPLKRAYVDVFVAPPSIEALRERLSKRSEDAPAVIDQRVQNARGELECWRDYGYLVVNDQLDEAYRQLRAIVSAEHCRVMPS
jgi:guanylate kinase